MSSIELLKVADEKSKLFLSRSAHPLNSLEQNSLILITFITAKRKH